MTDHSSSKSYRHACYETEWSFINVIITHSSLKLPHAVNFYPVLAGSAFSSHFVDDKAMLKDILSFERVHFSLKYEMYGSKEDCEREK